MTPSSTFLRYGLYYPYFHIRDDQWLKAAALYWPKIVRMVPDRSPFHDSRTVKSLADEGFVVRQPPGLSVQAVAPIFLDVVARHADDLSHLRIETILDRGQGHSRLSYGERLSRGIQLVALHKDQMDAKVQAALVDAGLALDMHVRSGPGWTSWEKAKFRSSGNLIAIDIEAFLPPQNSYTGDTFDSHHRPDDDNWIAVHPDLAGIYTSVLAEDFASSNRLRPTTDQADAYAVANNWTADRVAAALSDADSWLQAPRTPDDSNTQRLRQRQSRPISPDEFAETLGFLALELVVPANLSAVDVNKIIEIRHRYGEEFRAFVLEVEQAAEDLRELTEIRDLPALERYLKDEITERFAQPMQDLRRQLGGIGLDAVTATINIKTELPAAIGLIAGAEFAGQPLIASTAAVALGLLSLRRGVRRQRDAALEAAPAPSFLLHTREHLSARGTVEKATRRIQQIAGIDLA